MRHPRSGVRELMIAVVAGCGVLLAALALASPAVAQQADVAKAASEPIMKQLEAFRRDDYDAAYGFASTEVKQMFDRQAFERMVKGGYPEIARSTSALVAGTDVSPAGEVYVQVRIRGANGSGIEAVYQMVRERDGWKVNGVMTRPDSGTI